ncbi:MAG: heavy metal translocating P-type ATPase [Phytoplasma sp.]|uniref:heavy metal translocating P-type ATPase n=1 Tax=Phytoplasma sp. TaxID=2155 RepID=UPI002B40C42D|nr:heavy metal translocating P-type ATPase [Phytoplasma sp.]WRH06776.1 MAG: heavy metal translocating P-type ATPase [Phytoplasma sp.]
MNDYKTKKEFQSQNRLIYLFILGVLIYFVIFVPLYIFKKKEQKLIVACVISVLTGYSIIKEGFVKAYKETKKNKKLTLNVHILMILAFFCSFYMSNYNEAILLLIIFGIANFLEEYVDNKNQKEISKLLDIKPKKARLLKTNNDFEMIDVSNVKIGDKIMVLNGEKIPSDGIIISGTSSVDESTITGESIPVDKTIGDKVFSSNINLTNTLIIEVNTTEDKTIFSEIIRLTEKTKGNVSKKASLIKKIEPIYVKSVIFITFSFVIITQLVKFLFKNDLGIAIANSLDFQTTCHKSMVFLTVASPCALVVADIPATLSAISNLAKRGILLKKGSSLGVFSNITTIIFDKTGTLTRGKHEVQEIFCSNHVSDQKQIEYFNILWALEKESNHPIAFAIQKYLKNKLDKFNFDLKLKTINLIGIGIEGTDEKNNHYKIAKYNVFKSVPLAIEQKTKEFLTQGNTVIYFSHNNEIIMIIAVIDIIRSESQEMVKYFNYNGIQTIMLTGDNQQVAQAISSYLNINTFLSNCLPKEKAKYVNEIKEKNHIVAMIGDGVNDSPALASSDVSITLQEGSDVIIDIADIVLIKNDLNKVTYTHKLACKLNKIVWQNIIFGFSIILLFSLINLYWTIPLWLAVLSHEGSTLLVIFNCLRLRRDIK